MDIDVRLELSGSKTQLYSFCTMSLITRCPSCETLFKVVPDQLRVSEGWVRCGQCKSIFDAALHLLPTTPAMQWPPAQQPELPNVLTALDAAESPMPDDTGGDEVLSEPIASVPELRESDGPRPSFEVMDISPLAASMVTEPEWPADDDDSAEVEPETESALEPEANAAVPSFLQKNQEDTVWRKPLMRATLALLSLVLLFGLLGQMVLHERDRVAALAPGLRPVLLAVCVPLNCVLSPLRRIESIVIDSSSFTRVQGDAYRLIFTVKNTADTPLAVPAVELTLTDLTDQPVVRRVLLPAELGIRTPSLAAGTVWPITLPLAVKDVVRPDQISGYRLLTFYP